MINFFTNMFQTNLIIRKSRSRSRQLPLETFRFLRSLALGRRLVRYALTGIGRRNHSTPDFETFAGVVARLLVGEVVVSFDVLRQPGEGGKGLFAALRHGAVEERQCGRGQAVLQVCRREEIQ